MKAAHEMIVEDRLISTERFLTGQVNSGNLDFLSFLSDLGELDDTGRNRVLELARMTYDYKIEKEESSAWDYGCYRD